MVSRALPFEVTNILEKLEFIARIPPNHKVNIPDKTLQHKDSWWGAIDRGRKNVDRKSTLRDIQNIIDETAQVLNHFHKEPEYIRLVINGLRKASRPIKGLGEYTYGDDPSVGSEISVKLQTINIYLEKYSEYLDPLPHIDSPPKINKDEKSNPVINNKQSKYTKINKDEKSNPVINNKKSTPVKSKCTRVIADLQLSQNGSSSSLSNLLDDDDDHLSSSSKLDNNSEQNI